jgi:hypothetical protein
VLFILQALIAFCVVMALARTIRYYWELICLMCQESNLGKTVSEGKAKRGKKKTTAEENNQIELSLFNSLNPYKTQQHPSLMAVEQSKYRHYPKKAINPSREP